MLSFWAFLFVLTKVVAFHQLWALCFPTTFLRHFSLWDPSTQFVAFFFFFLVTCCCTCSSLCKSWQLQQFLNIMSLLLFFLMFWSFFALHLFFYALPFFPLFDVLQCILMSLLTLLANVVVFHVDYESPWSSLAFFLCVVVFNRLCGFWPPFFNIFPCKIQASYSWHFFCFLSTFLLHLFIFVVNL